jgi:AraC-like DNA-binding protein
MNPHQTDEATPAGIRAAVVKSFYQAIAEQYGEVVNEVLREMQLHPDDLDDTDALLSYRRVCVELMNRLAVTLADPHFGLHCAARTDFRSLGVLGYVVRHSASLRVAMANLSRYYTLMQTASLVTVTLNGAVAELSYKITEPGLAEYRQDAELTIALITRFIREAAGNPDWAPLEVHFIHTAPADTQPLQQFFQAPLYFAAAANKLLINSNDLDLRPPENDPGLLAVLCEHVENQLLRQSPPEKPFLDELQQQLATTLHAGEPGVESLAQRLNIGPRTLQRRLREQGLSYADLLSQTRRVLAERYLADPQLSLSEITFLIGYSEQSVFNRAFRGWTGKTPLSYRRERLNART